MGKKSIGIFDSGIGGLNTLKILKTKLPNENFIYLADNINLPYGEKKPEEILRFSKNIIEFFTKKDVKIIVVPCNTSTSIAIDEMRKIFPIKIFDIISPITSKISKNSHHISVIATTGTVKSDIYSKKLKKYNNDIKVTQISCPELVSIIEKNLIHEEKTDVILKEYLEPIISDNSIEKLIYGCTHYQYLDSNIKKILSESDRKIEILNPDDFLTEDIVSFLNENNLLNNKDSKQKIEFYTTGNAEQFFNSAKNFFDFIELKKINELKNFHNSTSFELL